MLHILLGRAKSGRTGIMARRIGRDISLGRRAVFIVPDQETFITESRLLKENGLNGLMGTEVLSFNRFCQRIIKWSAQIPGLFRGAMRTLRIISFLPAAWLPNAEF